MSSYRQIIRRKQSCRRTVYVLVSFGLLVYGLLFVLSTGDVEETKRFTTRHLLQNDQDKNVITKNNNSSENQTITDRVSVISSFINNITQDDEESSDNSTACEIPSIVEFPRDLFTQKQRKKGAVIIHVVVAIYMCVGLAVVCDYYFVPSLEVLCHKMRIQADVAGASLMAIGSSAPELCASIIGVFVTKGDIGIGTILGSAVFNLLFVIGICGVYATSDLKLSWWPITRDTVAYGLTIIVLAVVIFDNTVKWQEAVAMFILYIFYLIFMSQNQRIEKSFYLFIGDTKSYKQRFEKQGCEDETTPLSPSTTATGEEAKDELLKVEDKNANEVDSEVSSTSDASDDEGIYPDEPPEDIIAYPESFLRKVRWLLVFPIKLTFFLTIPDLRRPRCRGLVILTFFMSISWIGFLTYTLVWMVTLVGFTIDIPDSVMGLTFVAFGSSVPDALASMIVAKQGKGNMAVSQALGSNVFDILLGLGLPWTIKALMGGELVKVKSVGMLISCFVTFILAILVLLTLYLKKFILGKKIGIALLVTYAVYLIASVITELFLYQDYRLPMCPMGRYR